MTALVPQTTTPTTPDRPGEAALTALAVDGTLVAPEVAARLLATEARLRSARSPNTLRALAADLHVWQTWCRSSGHIALPATPTAVAAFLDALATERAPATLRRYLASIAALHRAARLPDPTKDEDVRLARAGAARTWAAARRTAGQSTRPRQAPGLTADAMAAILATYGPTGPTTAIDQRDVVLVLVARDLLARREELVALELADLTPARDGGATILIRRSKTDQVGEGAVGYLAPDTLRAIRAWLATVAATGADARTGRLLRSVHVTGRIGRALHAQKVPAILKKLGARAAPALETLGIDPAALSGHSCRVGMAQDLVAAGLELPAIMQAGRWRTSAMVARYAERLLAAQGAVARYHQGTRPMDAAHRRKD
ncbi:MAG: tyrosine-type recombinase/integrase [Gemmatimonadaceae bacterium]|jgi:integrase|nr:tyrosine-type recombinase/integrase [Gemmatimonadaceae bacterium]